MTTYDGPADGADVIAHVCCPSFHSPARLSFLGPFLHIRVISFCELFLLRTLQDIFVQIQPPKKEIFIRKEKKTPPHGEHSGLRPTQ